MFGTKRQAKPEPEPEPAAWWVDYRATLAALILSGTITTEEAEAVERDAVFRQGNAGTTTRILATEINEALRRIRGEVSR